MDISFGEKLKQLRVERNLTQEALADELQTVRSTINRYEKNSRKPDFETLIRIVNFFGVTTDYLLGRTERN